MSGDSKNLTMAYALESAAKVGMLVRSPRPNELFLDIDDDDAWEAFGTMLAVINQNYPAGWTYTCTPSKSGLPKRHVVVTMHRPINSELERVLLQAILGSDRKRETLSFIAIDKDINPKPTLFFEPFVFQVETA